MTLRDFQQWASHYKSIPLTMQLLPAIPYMPIPLRKCALAYTRVRTAITKGEPSLSMKVFAVELQQYVMYYESSTQPRETPTTVPLQMLLEGIALFRKDPITQGFLSTIIRSAPYDDYSSVHEAKTSAINKEIDAALSTSWKAPLNYQPIFSSKKIDRYVFPNMFLDPDIDKLCTLDFPFSYRYTVLQDFPVWAEDVSRLMHMSPHERFSITHSTGYDMDVDEVDITDMFLAED